jgi:hypothetical protein
LSLNQGAEYLVQKYGARIVRRVASDPPPTAVNYNGQRGYESSELEVWAAKANRIAAGREAPRSEVIEKRQDQGIVGEALEWMNKHSRGDVALAAIPEISGPRRPR